MDKTKATIQALMPNCIPEQWKAAKVRDLERKDGTSELFWMVGKEGDKDLLMPRPMAMVEIPTIAEELVHRWNAHPDLVAKLEELELRLTQARLASTIGRPKLKDADFLRGEMERIGQSARALIETLKA
jgi:hypothetical protein